MSKGEDQITESRNIIADLIPVNEGHLADRLQTLLIALDEVGNHIFVKGAIAVPFTAALARAANVARTAYADGDTSDTGPLEKVEAAAVKLQEKTTGTGGVAIT